MADSYQSAQSELDNTGSTTLQPSTAVWTFLRWLALVWGVLAIGSTVTVLVLRFPVSNGLALIPLVAILGGLWYLLGRIRRNQGQPVQLSSAGITIKGVGPVPWQHLDPPELQWLQEQYDSRTQEVPVLPLTEQGLSNAQRDLTDRQRRQLSGRGRLPFGDPPAVARLPAKIRGLSRDEYLSLLTAAHTRFAQPR